VADGQGQTTAFQTNSHARCVVTKNSQKQNTKEENPQKEKKKRRERATLFFIGPSEKN